MTEKIPLMLMMSLMTSQRDVIFGLLYSCLNEIVTFSLIQVVLFDQLSSNFSHIYSLTQHVKGQRSKSYAQVQKVGQILKWSELTLLISKLERRPKAQNVRHWTGYLVIMHNIQWHGWRKSSVWPQNFVSFENFVIFNVALIWHQKWKDHVRITQDKCIS